MWIGISIPPPLSQVQTTFPLWHYISVVAKSTVDFFLILSGFGLYRSQSKKNLIPLKFLKRRCLQIYPTYWIIFLIFVPLTLLLTDRTLEAAYGDNIITKTIATFFGLQIYLGTYGYNPTWWFMSILLPYYLFFPVFFFMAERRYILEIFFYALFLVNIKQIYLITPVLQHFLLSFILGIILAKHRTLEKWLLLPHINLLSVFMCFFLVILHLYQSTEWGNTLSSDSFLILFLIFPTLSLASWSDIIHKILRLMGEHSYSMFLFHTFINAFLLHSIVYVFMLQRIPF